MLKERKSFEERLKQEAHSRIVKILKETTESSADLQINHTPPEICSMMLDKVDLSSAKNVLALFNVEFLYELRLREYKGDVYYFTQSEKEVAVAKELMPNVIIKYIDKKESALEYMNTWPEKFDIIVSNPPYSMNLHLKFLDKALDLSMGEVVFVHPATSFVDLKGQNQLLKDINKKIEKCISSLTFFNGNPIFNIELYFPCSITHLNKNKTGSGFILNDRMCGKTYMCPNISKITPFGVREEFWTILEKVKQKETLQTKQGKGKILKNKESFFVEMSRVMGHSDRKGNYIYKNDFFVILNNPALIVKKGGNPMKEIWWEFETKKKAENFIKYCKTDFARFCLSLLKRAQRVNGGAMNLIPWVDFEEEWSDKRLYEHFGITEEEQVFIKEVIPPYYD